MRYSSTLFGSNRTFMELKPFLSRLADDVAAGSNRTFMELKPKNDDLAVEFNVRF